ncbi:GNAT family N-acetyltransferase [Streptomyces sp. LD120]|uniref:GNAT family N-acetyltransferase n=1 Tax=Streptomyces physcomitrii TaxID=2724184 RepID=A0ABX1H0V9_9ACTN|nr:GNAT family N-acetyltransferase [Streptomyces physcomitrii]
MSSALGTGLPRAGARRAPSAAADAAGQSAVFGWCRTQSEFAALAPEWERLYDNCRSATPFQSHAWLHSWWRAYGTRGRLRLALVRDGAGRLLAVAPLRAVRWPVPALVPLGSAVTDFMDVLLDDDHRGAAAEALVRGLSAAARTRLLDLGEARPGAATALLYEAWPGPRRILDDSVCLQLPAVPLESLLTRLAAPRAQRVRAKLRKLDALGIEQRPVPAAEAEQAVRTLLRLHRLQWQGRGVTAEHLRPRFAEHLVGAAGRMVAAGQARLTEFRLDGEVAAVDLSLRGPRLRGGYLYGADPRLRERKADVATMLLRSVLADCPDTGAPGGILSLLRGEEPYKHHWRPDTAVNRRYLLASRSTAPLLTAVTLDAAARQRARALRAAWRERTWAAPWERGERNGTGKRAGQRALGPEEKAKGPEQRSKAPDAQGRNGKGRNGKEPDGKAPGGKASDGKRPDAKAPVRKAPVRKAPVRKAPVREAPIREAALREAPIRQAPPRKAGVEAASSSPARSGQGGGKSAAPAPRTAPDAGAGRGADRES